MKKRIVAAIGLTLFTRVAGAQTTTLTQELAPGTTKSPCQVTGCINAYLSDGETFSFNDTLQYYGSYSILGNLSFRGVEYPMTGNSSGYEVIDLHNAQGFAIHEAYGVRCFRGCIQTWRNGYLVVPDEFVGVQIDRSVFTYSCIPGVVVNSYPNWPPTAFGGQRYQCGTYQEGPTTGTVQVNLAVPSVVDSVVTLSSSDPAFTVPGSLIIPAGQVAASGAINAAVIGYNQPGVVATITAIYPDGGTATILVTDDPGPAPPTVDDTARR